MEIISKHPGRLSQSIGRKVIWGEGAENGGLHVCVLFIQQNFIETLLCAIILGTIVNKALPLGNKCFLF